MSALRTQDDYKRAIRDLLKEAEISLEKDLTERDAAHDAAMSDKDVASYMQGLDLAISEEATLALRAEFLRFSSVFDTSRSRDTIRRAVADVTKPLIEEWINRHMADIAREVITEAIGKIAHVRPTGNLQRSK